MPPALRPGDRIGVAALSGPVDLARLDRGLGALEAMGYRPVEASNVRSRTGLFAGTDRQRLDAFHELAADSALRAIAFVRGGHGVLRVLPAIDWALLDRTPRAYVGYSDLTPFLLEVVSRLGLVAFHGPMIGADLARGLEAEEARSFADALRGALPQVMPLAGASEGDTVVEGVVMGGCLSMLTATLGTAHAADLRDCILVVEEVDEPLYRLDRMLTHLRLSGTLNRVRALVFGHLTALASAGVARDWRALLDRVEDGFEVPVAWGLPVGHERPNLTLPLGATGRLDTASRTLTIGRPRVSERRRRSR